MEPTFTAAVAVNDAASGTEGLAIFFVPQVEEMEEKIKLIEQVRKAVASNLGISPSVVVPVRKSEFPKTTSGKIQRNGMKKGLAAGDYDSILKGIDLALANANTVPNWFYRKAWRRKAVSAQKASTPAGGSIVFMDSLGLGDRLCAQSENCVKVLPGASFSKVGPHGYQINPAEPADYRELMKAVTDEGISAQQIVHLWSYRQLAADWAKPDRVQNSLDQGALSLLFLVQALADQPEGKRPARLLAGSSYSQHATKGDKLDCGRSAALGLLKSIPQELPWLACSHVDLQAKNIEQDSQLLLSELQSGQSDREVAWRTGERWVPMLQHVDFRVEKRPSPFKEKGLYLLTGGLGGIGLQVGKYLLKNYQARLLIVGRSPLPERSQWAQLNNSEPVAERVAALQELERYGEVMYEAADTCDATSVQGAVNRAKSRWSSDLDGVIHLAGIYQERLVSDESKQSFESVLQPKVQGSLVLGQLLSPGKLFLSFASVNGFFGGFSVGAYAAANAFQEALAFHQRESAGLDSQCLAWSLWDNTGMSRSFVMKELARTRGYYAIGRDQGMTSLLAALHQDEPGLLIGLDATKQPVRRHLDSERFGLQELAAYFVPQNGSVSRPELESMSIQDRYGVATACNFRALENMPLTASGEIDRQQLAMHGDGSAVEDEPLQTDVERALADVWAEVLELEKIKRNDNFFDLGGHSLSAVQITFKIRQNFNIEFPLKTFLEAPVLSAQAQQLEAKLLEQADSGELEKLMSELGSN